ncbi:uncharacterized protein THITE_2120098 [Thermothielavioides terrestris NRRL 8126]|uniref:DUF7587 domain-containing protein n=1 Tax=Thermothielavioides terrestris (strain ATCC 38088 / NRRL 8126) TaxID=578455 RepID=G2R9K0_THETT|nr:uncharacterized protein THITE_2120098 [Thermothielavioides terrestris NRRL 8126]AEO69544.1 hypothetical protein THITE_2120098 [Thermothielavioides terrestris NRRL 8126]
MQTHQALDGISEGLRSLNLDPPDCLLFKPSNENSWLGATFKNVPRYLFRVFTPMSRGATDPIWARSRDAADGNPNARRDIFARDEEEVASMLNQHLRWWEGVEDNFVSWTSSLLFALVYIFNRHASERDGSAFEDIFLCIVDTTLFPRGVFLRDLDLIDAFRRFDDQLYNLGILRREHRGGLLYFGEYLSQGALKIEGKCRIVSAQAMIDRGLYDLQPRFKEFADWQPTWEPLLASPVLELRAEFKQKSGDAWDVSFKEHLAAMDIADLFGGRWALPVAANLLALRPRRIWDQRILETFRAPRFTGSFSL